MRTNRTACHRAILASAVLHLALAGLIVLAVRSRPAPIPSTTLIDTRGDLVVRMFDAGPTIDSPAPVPSPTASDPSDDPTVVEAHAAPPSEIGRTPHATISPRTLSAETLAVIGRSVASSHIAGPSAAVSALHGAMRPDQSIVYILDCSGSMGEHGKLVRARAALMATLRAQPEGVRVQVIVYDSTARALFPGLTCVSLTAGTIETTEVSLRARGAMGRSNHFEALRAAIPFRPDAILLLTDADGLNRNQLRAVLAQLEKPTYICLSQVTASGVEPPHKLR